ncbi:MAG: lactonase family protein [Bryobacteraceae bacterium]|nr:lactonase family protein [Bryobacteraceae bacterium]
MALMTAMAADRTVYVGTYTRTGKSKGIERLRFDPRTGKLSGPELAVETENPSLLALHPTKPWLYSVNVNTVANQEGRLTAYAIGPQGQLTVLNTVKSHGVNPAYVQVDPSGRWLAAANFTSGSCATFRIEPDGRLSETIDFRQHAGQGKHPTRQAGPHAHSAYFSRDGRRLYVADLGLDEVKRYGFDPATGKLTDTPSLRAIPGGGPRHLAFGPGERVYVLNEILSSVSVFDGGQLVETVNALPPGFTGNSSAAEIVLHPKGKFLYSSNRGADTIAIFRVGKTLRQIGQTPVGGKTPRGFVISPDGKFLLAAAQDSDTVSVFRINGTTGLLTLVGTPVAIGSPVCLRFPAN